MSRFREARGGRTLLFDRLTDSASGPSARSWSLPGTPVQSSKVAADEGGAVGVAGTGNVADAGRNAGAAEDREVSVAPSPTSPGEVYPFIFYTKQQLRDSLRTELENLLSTRQAYTQAELKGVKRTTISYGIPDNMHVCPADPASRAALAQAITEAIRAYEPRLEEPSVVLHPVPGRGDTLNAEIQGHLRWQDTREKVNFIVPLDSYYEQR